MPASDPSLPLAPSIWSTRPGDLEEMEAATGQTIGGLMAGVASADPSWFSANRLLAIAFLTLRGADPRATWADARAARIDLFDTVADDG